MYRIFLLLAPVCFALSGQAQNVLWTEDFESYSVGYGWGNNGANSAGFDGSEANWTLSGDDNGDYFYVDNVNGDGDLQFAGNDLDGESIWTSAAIDIAGYGALNFTANLGESGNMESGDYIAVYYLADGGAETLIASFSDDFSTETVNTTNLEAASSLQFRVKVSNNSDGELHFFDDLVLSGCPDSDGDDICDDVDDCEGTVDGCGVCGGDGLLWSMATGTLTGGFYETFTFDVSSDLTIEEVGITLNAQGGTGDNHASDLLMAVIDPAGNGVEWGGFDATFGDGFTEAGAWPASWESAAESGSPWSATVDLSAANLSGVGTWTVYVANGWLSTAQGMIYDVDLTICDSGLGCTDQAACNYDAEATTDDGSCIAPHPELGCCSYEGELDAVLSGGQWSDTLTFEATGTPVSLGLTLDWTDLLPSTDDPSASALLLTVTDPNGNCISFGGVDVTAGSCTALGTGADWPTSWNTNGANYEQYTHTVDLTGSGLEGNGNWSIAIANGDTDSELVSYGLQWGFEGLCFISDEAEGCTDGDACNYDAAAVVDDGSCLMPDPLSGCACEQTGTQTLSLASSDEPGAPLTFLGSNYPGPTLLELDLEFTNVDNNQNCWPSDMVVRLLAPDSSCVWFGGWDANTPPEACAESDELNVYWPAAWNTPADGAYSAAVDLTGADLLTGTGTWSLTVYNGWSGTTTAGMTSNAVVYDLDWTLTGVCEIPGCTDSDAVNFLEVATEDDGSCLYGGCTDQEACNYDAAADEDDDSCLYLDACGVCGGAGIPEGDCDCDGNVADAVGTCGGDCTTDSDSDGICDDVDPCVGNLDACGICNGPGAVYDCGCAEQPEGDCDCNGNQLDALGVCGGDCLADVNCNGICDADEVAGCTYASACNYNPAALNEDGSCTFPATGLDCDGNCLVDTDGDGTCDANEIPGCIDPEAVNHHPAATEDDGTCVYGTVVDCVGDLDENGVLGVGDVLILLANYSLVCD